MTILLGVLSLFSLSSYAADPSTVTVSQTLSGPSNGNGSPETVPNTEVSANNNDTAQELKKSAWLLDIQSDRQEMSLVTGRSHLLKFLRAIGRISVSDPEVLDFLILAPKEILLNAKKEGPVNLIIWDLQNNVSVFDIQVVKDPEPLLRAIQKIDPKGKFEIYPSKDVFVVRGETGSVDKFKQIEKAANAFAEGSVTLVEVKDVKQILLQVRFMQLDRSQNYDFGIDMEFDLSGGREVVLNRLLPGATTAATSGDSTGTLTSGDRNVASTFDIFDRNDTDLYQINLNTLTRSFEGFVKALEEKGIVKTIARPNLLVKDGEEASFLVGGEAAIVTSTDESVNVTYKEFGTRLKFKAEILGEDVIRLTVEPEVSSLNAAFGVTVGATEVPGFTTTRVKSVIELKSGESFMVGGLLQQKMNTTDTGVPFLRRIPIFGKLFQSLNYEWDETELLVLVTPNLMTSETRPIPPDAVEGDILSEATQLLPSRIDDEQGEKARQYLKYGNRFVEKRVTPEKAEVKVEVKPVVSSPGSTGGSKPVVNSSRNRGFPIKDFGDDKKASGMNFPGGVVAGKAAAPAPAPANKSLDALEEELQWEKKN